MFTHEYTIALKETDSTGVLYFAEQFSIALFTMEKFFLSKGFSLQKMVEAGEFFLPVVHTEADFTSPLYVGDTVTCTLSLKKQGTSSFTLRTEIEKKGVAVGHVEIVHVAVSAKTRTSIPLPSQIKEFFGELVAGE